MRHKIILGGLFAALAAAGAATAIAFKDYPKEELSDILHEEATATRYYEKGNASSTQYSGGTPTVVGRNIMPGTMRGTYTSTRMPSESYGVVFDGKVRFIVGNEEIYQRFENATKADVSYQEKYRKFLFGNKELVSRTFVDAQPITEDATK